MFKSDKGPFVVRIRSMNLTDYIVVLILILAAIQGWQRGFIHSLAAIIIWALTVIGVLIISDLVAKLSEHFTNSSETWLRPLLFILMLAISSPFAYNLIDTYSARISAELHSGKLNKYAGILPGMVSGLFYAMLISIFLISYPNEISSDQVENSIILSQIDQSTEKEQELIGNALNKLGFYFGRSLTVYPKEKEIIKLPFKTSSGIERRDLEAKMLDMINEERKKHGLHKLQTDKELAQAARMHSADMLKRAYFSHYTPEGKNTFNRLQFAGISYNLAGENLALAENTTRAHYELMSSPIHKANILNKTFTHSGVGILDAGRHGLMITQMFKN